MYTKVWQKGGSWLNIETEKVQEWIDTTSNTDIFKSVQEYKNEDDEDIFKAPLYFDFDSEDINLSKIDTLKVVDFLQKFTAPEIYF